MPPPQNALENTHCCVCITAHHTPRRRAPWNVETVVLHCLRRCWQQHQWISEAQVADSIRASVTAVGRTSSHRSSKANDGDDMKHPANNQPLPHICRFQQIMTCLIVLFVLFSFQGQEGSSSFPPASRIAISSVFFSRAALVCVFDVCPMEARPYRPNQVIF